jgi:hypothetical protein
MQVDQAGPHAAEQHGRKGSQRPTICVPATAPASCAAPATTSANPSVARWHVYFTPTSSSWINQVERFFALLSEQQIKRGAHRSVVKLEAAITAYNKIRNAAPKPFRWTIRR